LRNAIAHDYAGDSISETFTLCRHWTPVLLKVIADLDDYIARLPGCPLSTDLMFQLSRFSSLPMLPTPKMSIGKD
ncbi:MAG: hypothetical protein WCI20_13275, partial [bacterium]